MCNCIDCDFSITQVPICENTHRAHCRQAKKGAKKCKRREGGGGNLKLLWKCIPIDCHLSKNISYHCDTIRFCWPGWNVLHCIVYWTTCWFKMLHTTWYMHCSGAWRVISPFCRVFKSVQKSQCQFCLTAVAKWGNLEAKPIAFGVGRGQIALGLMGRGGRGVDWCIHCPKRGRRWKPYFFPMKPNTSPPSSW